MDLLENINKAELSATTKRNYSDRVSTILSKSKASLNEVVLNPNKYISKFKSWFKINTSLKIYLSIILGIFKYNPKLKEDNEAMHKKWLEAFKEAEKSVVERYESNKPSDKQKEGYVKYEDIIKVRDDLKAGTIEKLLLDFYTYIKPLRCDYARVRLYKNGNPKDFGEPNYIHNNKLYITKFKTMKSHDKIEIKLPEEVIEDLKLSLKDKERDWLFMNNNGEPFSSNSFTSWTKRVFLRLFKKPLTISLIRHSYISNIDFNTLSIKDKKEIADQMAHSVETQDKYRLIFTDKNSDCDCECKKK